MTKTAVHVTTIEEWKSVLDALFEQEYKWYSGGKEYKERLFELGGRYLFLGDRLITWDRYKQDRYIEYAEFMAQQKDDNKMEKVYEVSQSVFDELQRIKTHKDMSLIGEISLSAAFIKSIKVGNKAILRYLADDPAIEFKVKEPLYRLWRIDNYGDRAYMTFNSRRTPFYTMSKENAFTAPLEEIEKWKTPAWEIEEVD